MSQTKLQSLWDKYHDTFGSWFPTMCFPTDDNEDLMKRLQQCLKSGKPAEVEFELDYSEGIFY